jgi:hypothetical protein
MTDAATTPRIVAEVRSRADLHQALRLRAEEISISRLTIDAIAGLSAGHSSKILATKPLKGLTLDSAALLAPAMGLALALVETPESVARVKRRWAKREERKANTMPIAASSWALAGELRREQCRKAGKISMRQLRRPERQALGRKGGAARAEALTSRRRSEIARQAAISRWSRRMPDDESSSMGIGA